MTICEEYLRRHGLKIPLVKRIQGGDLFFQTRSMEWSVLTISWQHQSNHPGFYTIRNLLPLKEGWKNQIYFVPTSEYQVHADEYEEFILNWSERVTKVAVGEEECISAAWEIALHIFDVALIKESAAIFDIDLSDAQLIDRFIGRIPGFSGFWRQDILRFIDQRLDWLGELTRARNGL
jgi:hypothetical protein